MHHSPRAHIILRGPFCAELGELQGLDARDRLKLLEPFQRGRMSSMFEPQGAQNKSPDSEAL